MTKIDFTPEQLAALKEEIRVVFDLDDYVVLEYLVDDSQEGEGNTVADRAVLAWQSTHGRLPSAAEVSVEDEEEDPVMAIYCRGIDQDDLLRLVQKAVPEDFTAAVVPVPEGVYSGSQIAISRR